MTPSPGYRQRRHPARRERHRLRRDHQPHPHPRAGAGAGDDFTVTGTFKHDWFTPFIDGLDLTSYTATSTMRLETDLLSLTECPADAGFDKSGSKKSGKKSGKS